MPCALRQRKGENDKGSAPWQTAQQAGADHCPVLPSLPRATLVMSWPCAACMLHLGSECTCKKALRVLCIVEHSASGSMKA